MWAAAEHESMEAFETVAERTSIRWDSAQQAGSQQTQPNISHLLDFVIAHKTHESDQLRREERSDKSMNHLDKVSQDWEVWLLFTRQSEIFQEALTPQSDCFHPLLCLSERRVSEQRSEGTGKILRFFLGRDYVLMWSHD